MPLDVYSQCYYSSATLGRRGGVSSSSWKDSASSSYSSRSGDLYISSHALPSMDTRTAYASSPLSSFSMYLPPKIPVSPSTTPSSSLRRNPRSSMFSFHTDFTKPCLSPAMNRRNVILGDLARTSRDFDNHAFLSHGTASRLTGSGTSTPCPTRHLNTYSKQKQSYASRSITTDFGSNLSASKASTNFTNYSSLGKTFRDDYHSAAAAPTEQTLLKHYAIRHKEHRIMGTSATLQNDRFETKIQSRNDLNHSDHLLNRCSREENPENDEDGGENENRKRESVLSNDSGIGSIRNSRRSRQKSGDLALDLLECDNSKIPRDLRVTGGVNSPSLDEGVHLDTDDVIKTSTVTHPCEQTQTERQAVSEAKNYEINHLDDLAQNKRKVRIKEEKCVVSFDVKEQKGKEDNILSLKSPNLNEKIESSSCVIHDKVFSGFNTVDDKNGLNLDATTAVNSTYGNDANLLKQTISNTAVLTENMSPCSRHQSSNIVTEAVEKQVFHSEEKSKGKGVNTLNTDPTSCKLNYQKNKYTIEKIKTSQTASTSNECSKNDYGKNTLKVDPKSVKMADNITVQKLSENQFNDSEKVEIRDENITQEKVTISSAIKDTKKINDKSSTLLSSTKKDNSKTDTKAKINDLVDNKIKPKLKTSDSQAKTQYENNNNVAIVNLKKNETSNSGLIPAANDVANDVANGGNKLTNLQETKSNSSHLKTDTDIKSRDATKSKSKPECKTNDISKLKIIKNESNKENKLVPRKKSEDSTTMPLLKSSNSSTYDTLKKDKDFSNSTNNNASVETSHSIKKRSTVPIHEKSNISQTEQMLQKSSSADFKHCSKTQRESFSIIAEKEVPKSIELQKSESLKPHKNQIEPQMKTSDLSSQLFIKSDAENTNSYKVERSATQEIDTSKDETDSKDLLKLQKSSTTDCNNIASDITTISSVNIKKPPIPSSRKVAKYEKKKAVILDDKIEQLRSIGKSKEEIKTVPSNCAEEKSTSEVISLKDDDNKPCQKSTGSKINDNHDLKQPESITPHTSKDKKISSTTHSAKNSEKEPVINAMPDYVFVEPETKISVKVPKKSNTSKVAEEMHVNKEKNVSDILKPKDSNNTDETSTLNCDKNKKEKIVSQAMKTTESTKRDKMTDKAEQKTKENIKNVKIAPDVTKTEDPHHATESSAELTNQVGEKNNSKEKCSKPSALNNLNSQFPEICKTTTFEAKSLALVESKHPNKSNTLKFDEPNKIKKKTTEIKKSLGKTALEVCKTTTSDNVNINNNNRSPLIDEEKGKIQNEENIVPKAANVNLSNEQNIQRNVTQTFNDTTDREGPQYIAVENNTIINNKKDNEILKFVSPSTDTISTSKSDKISKDKYFQAPSVPAQNNINSSSIKSLNNNADSLAGNIISPTQMPEDLKTTSEKNITTNTLISKDLKETGTSCEETRTEMFLQNITETASQETAKCHKKKKPKTDGTEEKRKKKKVQKVFEQISNGMTSGNLLGVEIDQTNGSSSKVSAPEHVEKSSGAKINSTHGSDITTTSQVIDHKDDNESVIPKVDLEYLWLDYNDQTIERPPSLLKPIEGAYCDYPKYGIENFNFLKVLGRGSYGKVMLAELKNHSQYFAVKCLRKSVLMEDSEAEIEKQVLVLGSKHPYLCTLLCTFQSESHLFFVMEYLSGGDLMFHIRLCGKFDQDRARFYSAEIICALKFLHKYGIIYRDAKLDNICIDADGHVRLVDFGFCKLRIYRKECLPKNLCGTPDYMAPEIIKGYHYNQSVDWWSFGVLLYEMLTGQSPFNGTDEDELFWSVCNEDVFYPRFLTKEAKNLLSLLLNKDPEKRLGMPGCQAGDISHQEFFRSIDWKKVDKKQLKPPFKPQLKSQIDVSNFDSDFTMENAVLTPEDTDVIQTLNQDLFHDFTFTNTDIYIQ